MQSKILEALKSKLLKFGAAGILNTVLNYAIFSLLFYIGKNYLISAAIAYSLASINSFFINKNWTFNSDKNSSFRLIFQFFAINLLSLLIHIFCMFILVEIFFIHAMISQLFSIIGSMTFNFIAYSFLFREAESREQ